MTRDDCHEIIPKCKDVNNMENISYIVRSVTTYKCTHIHICVTYVHSVYLATFFK